VNIVNLKLPNIKNTTLYRKRKENNNISALEKDILHSILLVLAVKNDVTSVTKYWQNSNGLVFCLKAFHT
jgi:hypothetical protein